MDLWNYASIEQQPDNSKLKWCGSMRKKNDPERTMLAW